MDKLPQRSLDTQVWTNYPMDKLPQRSMVAIQCGIWYDSITGKCMNSRIQRALIMKLKNALIVVKDI